MQDQPPGGSSLVGRVLGHYRLVERVGAGGMGEVYRARDEHLHRDVAVKVLPPGSLRDENARRRLRKEALALSRLNHANIATVHDFDTQDGIDFLVMEFVPGIPVESLSGSRQAEPDVLALAVQLAEGLAAAHEEAVLHRDLKPANLRLTASGQLKILDFGLADLVAPLGDSVTTMTAADVGSISGTLPYMAPEQLQGGRPDARTDIYACGVVLYELATGRRPFRSPSSAPLMAEILYSTPPAPRDARPDLSTSFESVILRCMEKDPASRYPTAKALLEDLRRCATGAVPAAIPARTTRAWWKRVLAVGVPVLLLIAAVSAWMSLRHPTLAFANRDWLLIADFENLTGDAVFDKALDTALKVSIEQSSYVNVVPRRRISDALLRMKKAGTTRIDGALAREIAQREGFRAVLTPVIAGVGGAYALSATIENPATGASVKSAIVQAAKKNDVLPALDSLVRSVRRDLGESMSSLSPQARPLVKVTTSSIEALRQYSLAVEKHRDSKFEEAKAFYENALRIDPAFTAAQAAVGMLEFERFDQKRGKALLAQAIEHVDNLTERERYGILAFHARAVENDLPKAVRYLESFVAVYPDQAAAQNNLAVYYRQMGRFEDAVAAYRRAIRADPTFLLVRDGLAGLYLYFLGDAKAGIDVCRAELAVNGRHYQAWSNLGWAYLGAGDLAQAQAAIEKALEVDPKSVNDWYRLGHIHRLRKEYPEALAAFERIPAINPEDSAAHYELGVVSRLMKNGAAAKEHFLRYRAAAEKALRAEPKNAAHYIELGAVSLRMDQTDEAVASIQKAMAMDPGQHFGLATVLSIQGKTDPAIDQLELAIQKGFRNYIFLTIHTDLDNLRGEPRFQALLNRVIKK